MDSVSNKKISSAKLGTGNAITTPINVPQPASLFHARLPSALKITNVDQDKNTLIKQIKQGWRWITPNFIRNGGYDPQTSYSGGYRVKIMAREPTENDFNEYDVIIYDKVELGCDNKRAKKVYYIDDTTGKLKSHLYVEEDANVITIKEMLDDNYVDDMVIRSTNPVIMAKQMPAISIDDWVIIEGKTMRLLKSTSRSAEDIELRNKLNNTPASRLYPHHLRKDTFNDSYARLAGAYIRHLERLPKLEEIFKKFFDIEEITRGYRIGTVSDIPTTANFPKEFDVVLHNSRLYYIDDKNALKVVKWNGNTDLAVIKNCLDDENNTDSTMRKECVPKYKSYRVGTVSNIPTKTNFPEEFDVVLHNSRLYYIDNKDALKVVKWNGNTDLAVIKNYLDNENNTQSTMRKECVPKYKSYRVGTVSYIPTTANFPKEFDVVFHEGRLYYIDDKDALKDVEWKGNTDLAVIKNCLDDETNTNSIIRQGCIPLYKFFNVDLYNRNNSHTYKKSFYAELKNIAITVNDLPLIRQALGINISSSAITVNSRLANTIPFKKVLEMLQYYNPLLNLDRPLLVGLTIFNKDVQFMLSPYPSQNKQLIVSMERSADNHISKFVGSAYPWLVKGIDAKTANRVLKLPLAKSTNPPANVEKLIEFLVCTQVVEAHCTPGHLENSRVPGSGKHARAILRRHVATNNNSLSSSFDVVYYHNSQSVFPMVGTGGTGNGRNAVNLLTRNAQFNIRGGIRGTNNAPCTYMSDDSDSES